MSNLCLCCRHWVNRENDEGTVRVYPIQQLAIATWREYLVTQHKRAVSWRILIEIMNTSHVVISTQRSPWRA